MRALLGKISTVMIFLAIITALFIVLQQSLAKAENHTQIVSEPIAISDGSPDSQPSLRISNIFNVIISDILSVSGNPNKANQKSNALGISHTNASIDNLNQTLNETRHRFSGSIRNSRGNSQGEIKILKDGKETADIGNGDDLEIETENASVQMKGVKILRDLNLNAYVDYTKVKPRQGTITTPVLFLDFQAVFDSAEIVLEKAGSVNKILKCNNWSLDSFSCGDWIVTDIPFEQNSTHVWFSVESFSAYAGASITILNPYTYLRENEDWVVAFNTTGTADLIINSTNADWNELLRDNPSTLDEMKFLDISCGSISLKNSLQLVDESDNVYNYSQLASEDSIRVKRFFIPNYSCDETGYFSNNMLKAGYAILQFTYGDQVAYAYDPVPTYSLNQTNSTVAGTPVLFSLNWSVSSGALGGYIFSFYNGSNTTTTYNWTSTDNETGTQRFTNSSAPTLNTYITGYINPTNSVALSTVGWASASNAYTLGGTPATSIGAANANQTGFYGYSMGIPNGATITLIQVKTNISTSSTTSTNSIRLQLSNNSGTSYSGTIVTPIDLGSTSYVVLINGTTTWALNWNSTTANNIRVNVTSVGAATRTLNLDYVGVNMTYTNYTAANETNTSWSGQYNGLDGNDYQNVDKVGAVIQISAYDPSGSNTTYGNNKRPDIEVGFYNGTAYVNNSYCQANSTMGMDLLNTTAWNCTINKTDAQFLNSWKYQANRSVIIRGIWLDAFNNTIDDEVNVTGVYGYVDAWDSLSLVNDTWLSFGGATWSNVTKTINSTQGANITWCVYANDSANNWNGTSCTAPFSFLTTAPPQTYIQNLTQSLSMSNIQSSQSSNIRSFTSSLTLNNINSKLSNLFKSLTSSFTLTQSVSRLYSSFRSLTSSFSIDQSITKLRSVYNTLTQQLSISQSLSKLSNFSRSLTSSSTLNQSISRLYYSFKSLTSSFTISQLTTNLRAYFSSLDQSLTLSQSIAKLSNFFRSTSQSFSLSSISSRIEIFYNQITSFFNLYNIITSEKISGEKLYNRTATSSLELYQLLTNPSKYFNSLSQLLTVSQSISKIRATFSSLTSYFTLSQSVSKLRTSLASLTSSFTVSQSVSKIDKFFRSLTSAFTISQSVAKLRTSFSSLTQSSTVSQSLSKLSNFFRSTTSSFTLNQLTTKLRTYSRSMIQSSTISQSISKISKFYSSITSYFNVSQSVLRVQFLYKALTSSFTATQSLYKSSTFSRLQTTSYTISQTTTRLNSFYKSLVSYFTLSSSSSSLSSFYRALTNSISFNAVYSRVYASFRSITGYFTVSPIISKIGTLTKSLYQPLDANAISSRVLIKIRGVSQSFNLSAISSRAQSLFVAIYNAFNLGNAFSKIYSGITSTYLTMSQGLGTNTLVYRFLSAIMPAYQNFNISMLTGRMIYFQRDLSQFASITAISGRLSSFYKDITSYLAINTISSRVPTIFRSLSQPFMASLAIFRVRESPFSALQSLSMGAISSRASSLIRMAPSSFTIANAASKTSMLFKLFTAETAITDMINRMRTVPRIVSETAYLSATMSRIQALIRTIFQPTSISQLIKRIWLVYSKNYCSSIGDEESCAASSCYYCSGSCQSTTCSAPAVTLPPSGGGGGWTPSPIISTVPEVKAVLDTEVGVRNSPVNPGDKVYAIINLMKVAGPEGAINVNISYWIEDDSGNILGMKQTTVGVETIRSDIYYLTVPVIAPTGTYTFQALAEYNSAADTSFDNFEVTATAIKPPVVVKRIDVPFMTIENNSIKVILENLENREISVNATLFLPYIFVPQNITKTVLLKPLSEEVVEFAFIPTDSGSFSGFVEVQYEEKKVVEDFTLYVYPPNKFLLVLIGNYQWVIILALIVLLAFFVYKIRSLTRKKKKTEYVSKRKDFIQ